MAAGAAHRVTSEIVACRNRTRRSLLHEPVPPAAAGPLRATHITRVRAPCRQGASILITGPRRLWIPQVCNSRQSLRNANTALDNRAPAEKRREIHVSPAREVTSPHCTTTAWHRPENLTHFWPLLHDQEGGPWLRTAQSGRWLPRNERLAERPHAISRLGPPLTLELPGRAVSGGSNHRAYSNPRRSADLLSRPKRGALCVVLTQQRPNA